MDQHDKIIKALQNNYEAVLGAFSEFSDDIDSIKSDLSTTTQQIADYEIQKDKIIDLQRLLKDLKQHQPQKGDLGPIGPKGDKGDSGKNGVDGLDGIDGRDGKDGNSGKDGSPDSAEQIKSKLESLTGEFRLDASAIKNWPDVSPRIAKDGYPYGLPQPAGAITYQLNGAQVGRGNILNIVSPGATAVQSGDKVTYTISGGGSFSLPITTNLAGGVVATYDQTNNFLGLGITGAGQTFDTGSGGINLIASIDTSPFGGSPDTTIIGYLTTGGPGGAANSNYSYDPITDTANITNDARTLSGKSAIIEISANPTSPQIEFSFSGGGNYKVPITSPTPGTAMGYVSPGQLGWVAVGGGGGIAIGDPVTGGSADSILFIDGSGNLAEDVSRFIYQAGGTFAVRGPGGEIFLRTNPGIQYGIGDLSAVGNKNYIDINDTAQLVTISASDQYQVIDGASNQWIKLQSSISKITIGDAGNALNGNRFEINDASELTTLYTSKEFQVLDNTANFRYLDINPGSNLYAIGDMNGSVNFTWFNINDFAKQVFVQTGGDFGVQNLGGSRVIDANMSSGAGSFFIKIGDASSSGNGMQLSIDDAGQFAKLGDVNSISNGTLLVIDDANILISADSRDGIIRLGDFNGLGLGAYFEAVNSVGSGQVYRHGGIVDDRIDIQAYGTTRNVTNRDYFIRIGTSGSGATTINLPTGTNSPEGQTFVISDFGNSSSSGNNITVDAGGGSIIRGRHDGVATSAQTLVINKDGQAVTLKKISSSTWAVESET